MEDHDKDLWSDIGHIRASRYRKLVIDALQERPYRPKNIADNSDIDIAHISRALGDLKDRGIVKLLVPEDTKKGRFYGLSDRGEEIVSEMDETFNES